jgi:endoglucanase
MCYIDDDQSFSTNEPSINYGAALSWMASFLADQGASGTPRPAANACRVTYGTASAGSGGGFTARISVTNTGTTALKGWTLRFAFTGDQRVQLMSQGRPNQSGPVVEVRNEPGNATIAPGQTVGLGFTGTVMPGYPNATPALFTVNGMACTG